MNCEPEQRAAPIAAKLKPRTFGKAWAGGARVLRRCVASLRSFLGFRFQALVSLSGMFFPTRRNRGSAYRIAPGGVQRPVSGAALVGDAVPPRNLSSMRHYEPQRSSIRPLGVPPGGPGG